jgi:hypothetical protein
MKALRSDGQVVPSCWAAALLRGRPKSVISRAPDLAKRENSITPFDCPCDNAAQLFGELEGALGFAAVGEEPAGLPAQRVAVVPAPLLGSALGNGRVLSEPTSSRPPPPPMRLRPAA